MRYRAACERERKREGEGERKGGRERESVLPIMNIARTRSSVEREAFSARSSRDWKFIVQFPAQQYDNISDEILRGPRCALSRPVRLIPAFRRGPFAYFYPVSRPACVAWKIISCRMWLRARDTEETEVGTERERGEERRGGKREWRGTV